MLKSSFGALAAASLALAPVSVQAGTRAGDAVVSMDRVGVQVLGAEQIRTRDDDDDRRRFPFGFLIGGAIAAFVLAIVLADKGEDNSSRGAN